MAGHTPGPWRSIIDDTGGQWSGWPLCVCPVGDDDRSVVRTGGQWPYEWDAYTSQAEAVANARLIAAAPELLEAMNGLLAFTGQMKPSQFVDALYRLNVPGLELCDPGDLEERLVSAHSAAWSAIAKATQP